MKLICETHQKKIFHSLVSFLKKNSSSMRDHQLKDTTPLLIFIQSAENHLEYSWGERSQEASNTQGETREAT